MRLYAVSRKSKISTIACLAMITLAIPAFAQEQVDQGEKRTRQPVFRVSKLPDAVNENDPATPAPSPAANENIPGPAVNRAPETAMVPTELIPRTPIAPAPAVIANPEPAVAAQPQPHPLDRAIVAARNGLEHCQQNVNDYTAILVKRERVDGVVGEQAYMQIKVRNPKATAAGNVPFSVYMKFLMPRKAAGREVIYVDGWNDGNLLAHETSALLRFQTFELAPDGMLAMRGNRHPITECGIENLIAKLIEKAERDREAGDCMVEYRDNGTIQDRPCDVIELQHPEARAPFEFHKAQVFIDKELGVPVRYAAYDWPRVPGGEPELIEEYTYVNIMVNVGLTDEDFMPNNPNYNFPGR